MLLEANVILHAEEGLHLDSKPITVSDISFNIGRLRQRHFLNFKISRFDDLNIQSRLLKSQNVRWLAATVGDAT